MEPRNVDQWPKHITRYVSQQLEGTGICLENVDLANPTVVQRAGTGEPTWEAQYFCCFSLDGIAAEEVENIRGKYDLDIEAQFDAFCSHHSFTLLVTVQTEGARLLLKDGWHWEGSMENVRWDLGELYVASMPGIYQLNEHDEVPDTWDMSIHGPSNLLTYARLMSFHIAIPSGYTANASPLVVSPCVYGRFYNEAVGAFTRVRRLFPCVRLSSN